jgi:hypothetical protein
MRRTTLLGNVVLSLLVLSTCLWATAPSASAQTLLAAAPKMLTPPSISGKAIEGIELKGSTGSWQATAPITYGYTWLRCNASGEACVVVAGANGASLKLTGKDSGHTVELEVTAHGSGGAASARSKPTATIAHSAARIAEEIELRIYISLGLFLIIGVIAFKLLIGVDGRVSTSKTVAIAWTYLLASAILAFVLSKFGGYPQGLDNLMHAGLEGQYGLLIGGPLGAAIAAKGIVGAQLGKDPTAKTSAGEGESANPLQLVQNDAGETDLGDFQYVLFNLVAMVFFVGTIFGSPAAGLPHIPDVLLALTSVGAVGYVAKKTLPNATPKAKLKPATAKAKDPVKVTGSRLLTGSPPGKSAVMVLFGASQATILKKDPVPGGEDTIEVEVPEEGLTVGKEVDVAVITSAPSRISAGKFKLIA